MSCFFKPYLASSSSSKIASSKVFEHSRPMLNRNGRGHLARLAVPHHRRRRRLAAHPDQREPLVALLLGFWERQRVGAVRVARSGGGEDLLLRLDHDRFRLPGVVVLDARHERGVDVVVLAQPDQQRRDESTVLAHLVHGLVGRSGEVELTPDPGHLVGLAHPAEQVHVGRRFPCAESRARSRARGAPATRSESVHAVVEAELLFEVERDVLALFVLVADDIVGAGDDTTGAAGAQAGGDDLGVELLPLRRPPPVLVGEQRGWDIGFDGRHLGDCMRASTAGSTSDRMVPTPSRFRSW